MRGTRTAGGMHVCMYVCMYCMYVCMGHICVNVCMCECAQIVEVRHYLLPGACVAREQQEVCMHVCMYVCMYVYYLS